MRFVISFLATIIAVALIALVPWFVWDFTRFLVMEYPGEVTDYLGWVLLIACLYLIAFSCVCRLVFVWIYGTVLRVPPCPGTDCELVLYRNRLEWRGVPLGEPPSPIGCPGLYNGDEI